MLLRLLLGSSMLMHTSIASSQRDTARCNETPPAPGARDRIQILPGIYAFCDTETDSFLLRGAHAQQAPGTPTPGTPTPGTPTPSCCSSEETVLPVSHRRERTAVLAYPRAEGMGGDIPHPSRWTAAYAPTARTTTETRSVNILEQVWQIARLAVSHIIGDIIYDYHRVEGWIEKINTEYFWKGLFSCCSKH